MSLKTIIILSAIVMMIISLNHYKDFKVWSSQSYNMKAWLLCVVAATFMFVIFAALALMLL